MKYVLLGSLNAATMTRQEKRTTTARAKLKELDRETTQALHRARPVVAYCYDYQ